MIVRLARENKDAPAILDALIVADIQDAADVLRPVWERTNGRDGFVSIEVAPMLAHDTRGSIAEAHRLWDAVNRPNLMVKIPGTEEGIPAIRQCLVDGLNINITLLFSIAHYEAVAQAFLEAIEARLRKDQSVDRLASVASFFVSRVDTIVDRTIEARRAATSDRATKAILDRVVGTVAIANAKLAYARFEELFGPASKRFARLAAKGAQVQRPLWASMSMKDPRRRDVLYVEELIAPDTIDTMPPATIEAFRDHGQVRGDTAREGVAGARQAIRTLGEVGINLDELTAQLEDDGIRQFTDSFNALLAEVARKAKDLCAV